jgi:hypothetical protein
VVLDASVAGAGEDVGQVRVPAELARNTVCIAESWRLAQSGRIGACPAARSAAWKFSASRIVPRAAASTVDSAR